MINFYPVFYLLCVNVISLILYNKIKSKLDLFDYPNSKRKIHSKKVFLGGGFLIIINMLLFFILLFFFNNLENNYFYSTRNYISFFFVPLLLFIIGYFDDKKDLSANLRLILVGLLIYCALTIDSDLLITEIKFNNLEKIFYLNNFSTTFTIICFLLFINAFNMFDGINLQAGTYSLVIFFILFFHNTFYFLPLLFILILFTFLYLNYFNKVFLGESGCLLISYYISFFFIKSYNINKIFLCDEILLFLLFPGLDLLRLFIYRIYKGSNPFKADKNHIHHLLLKKHSSLAVFIIIFLSYLIPIIISIMTNNYYFGIVFVSINYFFLLLFYKKNII
jgi:UDP-GlcNAc:undecaprenyl-phosphate GlcNAc-1-phosphate transferase